MTTAGCPDANELLGYVTHRLDEGSQAEVEAHLDTCSDCMALLVELVRFDASEPAADLPRDAKAGREGASDAAASAGTGTGSKGLFGKYRLEAALGQGAMGTVYAARDRTLDRKVALKILRPHADAGGARARLIREARAMARLSHPNVVTVYDAGELAERLYIAMELFSGSTLASWLRGEDGAAPRRWEDALALLLRAGEGLAAAHAAGLVHRDFKPENVLLGATSEVPRRVVVSDFGLVAAPAGEAVEPAVIDGDGAEPLADVALTRTGVVMGTPRYMSPEQFRGGTVDARSDQFSFAVTAYEALYRQRPFAGRTLEELRRSVDAAEVAPPPAESTVPVEVHRALLRALARDPGERHPSLADLLRELAVESRAVTSNGRTAPAVDVRPRGPRNPRWTAAAALGVAVLGASAALWRWAPGRSSAADSTKTATAASVQAAPSGAPRQTARTAVVVGPLENRTGDARFDGVAATMLAMDIDCSRSFDAFTDASALALAEEVGAPPETTTPAAIAAAAAADGRRVVQLSGDLASANGRLTLTLARAGASSPTQSWSLDAAADGSDLAQRLSGLALTVRAALGEAEAAPASRPSFSRSLEALSAWSAARRSTARREWPDATRAAAAAVKADPDFQLARADLSWSLGRESRESEAIAAVRPFIDHPDGLCERQRLLTLANYYGLQTRNAAATNAFHQYLTLWPGDLPAQARVTATLLDDHDVSLAVEAGRSALADHPHAVPARTALVPALFMASDFAGVVREGETLRRTVARAPEHVLTRLVAAHALLDQDDEALAVIHQQATYDPEIADEEEADLAMLRGRLDDAEGILRRQIRALSAENDVTYARTENLMLAQLLVQKGDLSSARAAAKDALVGAVAEASQTMLYDLAEVFLRVGAEAESAHLAQVLANRPGMHGSFARLLAGDRLRAHGKRDEAAAAYEDALRLEERWIIHVRIGELALDRGDRVVAERELSRAVRERGEGYEHLEPGLHYLPQVYAELARAQAMDGGK